MTWPEFSFLSPRPRDFYLVIVHASVTCGRFEATLAFAGYGIAVSW